MGDFFQQKLLADLTAAWSEVLSDLVLWIVCPAILLDSQVDADLGVKVK
jgi:hypothetical protein